MLPLGDPARALVWLREKVPHDMNAGQTSRAFKVGNIDL